MTAGYGRWKAATSGSVLEGRWAATRDRAQRAARLEIGPRLPHEPAVTPVEVGERCPHDPRPPADPPAFIGSDLSDLLGRMSSEREGE
jgi:hypothetical protein